MDLQELAKTVPLEGEVVLESTGHINNGDEYLTFCLGSEQYGFDILSVKEIRGWEQPTLIPNSPEYVKGVINIRGTIIPIIDLRIRFGVGKADYRPTTVVIVLAIEGAEKNCMMGFVVDAVSDVLTANPEEIKKAPAFGRKLLTEMASGLVNSGEGVVTILITEKLMALEDS